MSVICNFVARRNKEITSLAAVATVIVGVLGFAITYWQLRQTTLTLQASNTYQVQKDARDIVEKIGNKPDFLSALNGDIPAQNSEVFLANIWIIFNFYLSVYRQSEINGLSPDFVRSFRDDFCEDFLPRRAAAEGWEKLRKQGRLGVMHVQMREKWCSNAQN